MWICGKMVPLTKSFCLASQRPKMHFFTIFWVSRCLFLSVHFNLLKRAVAPISNPNCYWHFVCGQCSQRNSFWLEMNLLAASRFSLRKIVNTRSISRFGFSDFSCFRWRFLLWLTLAVSVLFVKLVLPLAVPHLLVDIPVVLARCGSTCFDINSGHCFWIHMYSSQLIAAIFKKLIYRNLLYKF